MRAIPRVPRFFAKTSGPKKDMRQRFEQGMSEMGHARPGFFVGSDVVHRSRFQVGAVSIQMASCRETDVALVSPLEPFRVDPGVSDIDVRVEWVPRLRPAPGRQLFHSGSTWELHEGDAGFQFDFNAAIFGDRPFKRLVIDSGFRHATLQMNEDCLASFPHTIEPLGYPLDELLIMHRLTQEKAIELHSCGIVRADGTGNLFVGHSGAGKSTTTRLWTEREDVEVLSDDRIIVRRDEGRDDLPVAAVVETPISRAGRAGEREVLRLRDRSASPNGHSAQDDRAKEQIPPLRFANGRNDKGKMRMYGTPWHGEAMYASPGSALLARIFILEHGHGNVITRLSPSQAVAELFARSFVPFHRHEYVDSALEFLQEVVDTVPCYRYSFEPDERAVERIIHFRD
jgi:hypothetical protein